ncbi:DUF362 domain-containing protein [bacterium]|nr:DUF362 domain-containing protein [bacterium]
MATPKKKTTAKLYFADASADRFDYNLSLPAKLDRIIAKLKLGSRFKKGGTHRTIPPVLVRTVVNALKKMGARPFVADSVRIRGYRYLQTALEKGYNELTLGCPVIMADGIYGNDSVEVKAGKHLKAAMSTFKHHKMQHISFLLDLQPECDCMPMSGVPLVSDIGILAGEDMIAIDWATLDMIGDSKPNPGSMEEHLENSRENDVFAQVNNRDTRKYLEFAEKMGVGTTKYKIEDVG